MVNRIVVESGIPLRPAIKRELTYPFDKMQIGDSIAVEASKSRSILGSAYHWAARQKNGAKFALRVNEDGARIWRVA